MFLPQHCSCVCGHIAEAHYLTGDGCNQCLHENKSQEAWQHRFKLDNLTYVEKLAKERGLV
jgi:hypothetical protein